MCGCSPREPFFIFNFLFLPNVPLRWLKQQFDIPELMTHWRPSAVEFFYLPIIFLNCYVELL